MRGTMGTSPRAVEARHRLPATIEDLYKRRLPRSKVKDVEKPFHLSIQDRSSRCKFSFLKLILLITICGTFVMLLYSPEVYNTNHLSSSGSRWIWGGLDPRYISNIETEWDDIMKITEKLTGKDEFQGIGLVNFNKTETAKWKHHFPDATHVVLPLEYAANNVTWESLYPEWIDEEEETEVPVCPSLPSLRSPGTRLNLIAVKLPCRNGGNWSRDVARLHLQLAAAALATSFKGNYPLYVLFIANCFPIPNLFTCKELVKMCRITRDYIYQQNWLRIWSLIDTAFEIFTVSAVRWKNSPFS